MVFKDIDKAFADKDYLTAAKRCDIALGKDKVHALHPDTNGGSADLAALKAARDTALGANP